MRLMKILALSGWGQPHNALAGIAPYATHFDYSHFPDAEVAIREIAVAAQGVDAIIGWSLGGQLAVRAVAAGLIKLKKLVLIGVPFQFVKSDDLHLGMPQDQFEKFRGNYAKNPARTIAKSWELVALGDANIEQVRGSMGKNSQQEMLAKDWLKWLDMLRGFSCSELDFSNFPHTLLLHGEGDAVVAHNHAQEFARNIQGAKHVILGRAGHAPHWHNPELIRRILKEHLIV